MADSKKTAKKKPSSKRAIKNAPESGHVAVPDVVQALRPRQLKAPAYTSFRLQKRIKTGRSGAARLPNAFRIFGQSAAILARNWKVFLGIVLVYTVLNVVLVRSFAGGGDFEALKNSVDGIVHGNLGQLAGGALLFTYLLGSSGNTASPTAGAFQLIVTLIVSLALIWTLRHAYAKRALRIRDGFYEGMYPLVQFLLVLGVVGLQLLPAVVGVGLYTIIVGNSIATTVIEQILWLLIAFMGVLISLYMMASSLFALYMVTLPDMTPLKALRSARKLVAGRRFMVMRKVLFLPLAVVVLCGLVVIPLIFWATPTAPWVFFVASMLIVPLIHSYMYTLYRELL